MPKHEENPGHDADADLLLKIGQNLQALKTEVEDKTKVNGRLLQQVTLLAQVVERLRAELKKK